MFEAAGQGESALRIWNAARRIGVEAKGGAKKALKRQYGGRAPGNGWIGWLLIVAAICAALSAAMCSGFRADPEDREIAATTLAAAAGLASLVALISMRLRPFDRAEGRVQAVVAGALSLAAGFTLARGAVPAGTAMVASAGVALMLLVTMFAVRAAKPEAAADIDGSTARAYLAAVEGSEVADFADPRTWLPRALADKA